MLRKPLEDFPFLPKIGKREIEKMSKGRAQPVRESLVFVWPKFVRAHASFFDWRRATLRQERRSVPGRCLIGIKLLNVLDNMDFFEHCYCS